MEPTYRSAPLKPPALLLQEERASGSAAKASPDRASFATGYAAEWQVQADFFRDAVPLAGDRHRRRFTFRDGSHVDIQAHVPLLAYTDSAKLAAVARFISVLGTGVAIGAITCQPMGVIIGLAWGGVAGAAISAASAPPPDAIWQGYTARYYDSSNAQQPWGTRYFYGWREISGHETSPLGQDLDRPDMPDLAQRSSSYSWWRWRHGAASPRSTAPHQSPADALALLQDSERLTQAMASFAPDTGTIGTPMLRPSAASSSSGMLLASALA